MVAGRTRPRKSATVDPVTTAVCACPGGRRSLEAEERRQLAEVPTRTAPLHQLLTAAGQGPHELDLALLHLVDEVAGVALAEQHLAGLERDPNGRPRGGIDARAQVHHAVGERQEALVVGGHDDDPTGSREGTQRTEDAVDLHVVEVGGGLVGEEQRRVVDERPRDRDALLLAAGQVAGPMPAAIGQAEAIEQLVGSVPGPPAPHAGEEERGLDVLARREARDQVEGLEDDPDGVPAVVRQGTTREVGHVDVAEADRPVRRREDAGEGGEERRLPAAARSQQQDELTRGHLQVEPIERADRVAAARVLDGEVLHTEHLVAVSSGDGIRHHAPPKAIAGSTRTARRSPARLATRPTAAATRGRTT